MRNSTAFVAAIVVLVLGPAGVQAAEEWGLPEEEVVRFEAKVVDIVCELTGDCRPIAAPAPGSSG